MVLESTIICFDNSEYQRNGDYVPCRLSAQKEAVNLVCRTKLRSNPENDVALMTLSDHPQVLATLTPNAGNIYTKLHNVQPKGELNLGIGVRIAHLALRHRQGKVHKMRIVAFVGSPIKVNKDDFAKVAKRFKKEKVNVDFVCFGDHEGNVEILTNFINTINGKEGSGSNLLVVPRGCLLSDVLTNSKIIRGEDEAGNVGPADPNFEFGFDANDDPELALALRLSMEEQRRNQQQDAPQAEVTAAAAAVAVPAGGEEPLNSEEEMLQRALALSVADPVADEEMPDFGSMTEDEQIAYALRMSMAENAPAAAAATTAAAEPMAVDEEQAAAAAATREVEAETERLLASVLENLTGLDPTDSVITPKKKDDDAEQN